MPETMPTNTTARSKIRNRCNRIRYAAERKKTVSEKYERNPVFSKVSPNIPVNLLSVAKNAASNAIAKAPEKTVAMRKVRFWIKYLNRNINQPNNQKALIDKTQLFGALNGSFRENQIASETVTLPQINQRIALLSNPVLAPTDLILAGLISGFLLLAS